MTLTIFLLLRADPSWLRLTRDQRAQIADKSLAAHFSTPGLRLRHFDAEAFHARISDIAVIEAEDPQAYYFAVEALRDSASVSYTHLTLPTIYSV